MTTANHGSWQWPYTNKADGAVSSKSTEQKIQLCMAWCTGSNALLCKKFYRVWYSWWSTLCHHLQIPYILRILLVYISYYKWWNTLSQCMYWHHERYIIDIQFTVYDHAWFLGTFCNISTTFWQEQDWPLTSACWVDSNVYGLDNVHGTRYLTAVDPFHSTSSAVHTYHHLTSVSVDIQLLTGCPGCTGNSSSIGKEPVSWSIPTSIKR